MLICYIQLGVFKEGVFLGPVALLESSGISPTRSEWVLFGTRVPSGGCSPHSQLGPVFREIFGSIPPGHPAPPTEEEREKGGAEETFCFLHHLLCLFSELDEVGVTRSGIGGGVWGGAPGHLTLRRLVPSPLASAPFSSPTSATPKATPRQGTGQNGGRAAHSQRVPGYYEVILFLSILGKNSKYKIIKVKIHHLDFVVVLRTVLPTVQFF